ncbi:MULTISPECIES: hypothetical protein [unclassified Solwaraspora]|uniref:hypothetical protein n=1 Tax=unclassified Solwaraspora TaxID=2627926 RepID=UPI00259BCBAB|nr:hypothetical protein [Solwaraspora sp. WMMA2056]WJK40681.1 hypothetical protein O7608_30580 [Solwaraspora sp. WMMA2056]
MTHPGGVAEAIDRSTVHSRRGDWAGAIDHQRRAVALADELVAAAPDDAALRAGLGGLHYRLGSLHLAAGDPATAVAALDDAERAYAGSVGTVADAELSLADVLARRALAQSVRGWAASAEVDADGAVAIYLAVTGGDPAHPQRRDLARTLATNAATLASDGDPQVAVASANAALGYYGQPDSDSGGGDDPDTTDDSVAAGADGDTTDDSDSADGGYVFSAAAVSALLNFVDGRVVDGFLPAATIVARLPPDEDRQALEAELRVVDGMLSAAGTPVPFPPEFGRSLARLVLPNLRGRGLLWVPSSQWLDRAVAPTLPAAVQRHAGAAGQPTLAQELAGQDRPELIWTTPMRWWSGLSLDTVSRLAALAVEVLPRAYGDGRRLVLAAHTLFATAHRPRQGQPVPGPTAYLPTWQRLLEVAVDQCRVAGDDALAADLDGWRARVR